MVSSFSSCEMFVSLSPTAVVKRKKWNATCEVLSFFDNTGIPYLFFFVPPHEHYWDGNVGTVARLISPVLLTGRWDLLEHLK